MPHVICFCSHRNPTIFRRVEILPGCLKNYKQMQTVILKTSYVWFQMKATEIEKNTTPSPPPPFCTTVWKSMNISALNYSNHTFVYCYLWAFAGICIYLLFPKCLCFITDEFPTTLYSPHEHRKSDYELYVRKSEDLVSNWGWFDFFFFFLFTKRNNEIFLKLTF